ncbi:hypothetical protein NC652_014892 [Populus alba x Populus x berolinensis]|nr:hypothetical protein NC652_014892 [Populus alba x Populus x berolinensis]
MSPIAARDVCQNGSVKSFEAAGSMFEIDSEFLRLSDKPRPVNVERKRSFDERSFSENSFRIIDHLENLSPAGRSRCVGIVEKNIGFLPEQPVGTIAALDHSVEELNYDQVLVRDFVPSALAFLMNGEHEVVRNFLLKTLHLQSRAKMVDQFKLGAGVMPASFKVIHHPDRNIETLMADFGESAIGRVAPVDSGFWWIVLLRAYTKSTGDSSLSEMPECQREGFDTFPTLLCTDGCCMTHRRMGVYGYPIEIQALFFMALRCALILLKQDDEGKEFVERVATLL